MTEFNEKYENTNYSTVNTCGLAIFSNFQLHWFFSNLPFFERDTHMDSPEAIRVNPILHSCASKAITVR
jgi:hypothetical protein